MIEAPGCCMVIQASDFPSVFRMPSFTQQLHVNLPDAMQLRAFEVTKEASA